jgi:hypothetical protein
MGEEKAKTRQITGFVARLRSMSPEEKAAWYANRREKIARVRANRREEVQEWKRETVEKLANIVREDCLALDDPKTIPGQVTLWKIHALLTQGFTVADIRDGLLSAGACTEAGWDKLKKFLFEKHLSKIEDLGLDIFTSQQQSRELIVKEIKHLERMKKAKPFDVNLSKAIIDAAERLHRIQLELTKSFGVMGVVGDKKRGGNTINIISNVPRPKVEQAVQKIIDITPKDT